MRRREPRSVSHALDTLTAALAPATLLDLMSELVVARLNAALGRPAVRRLRVQARQAPDGPR